MAVLKNMRTLAVASVPLLFGACAVAQTSPSSVQLYGVLDVALTYVNNVGPTGQSLTRMSSVTGGYMPSRLGVRGSEDLGGGLSTVFNLEQGIALTTGALQQGGRGFGRLAYVGLSSKEWGTVTFGRQWSMLFFSLLGSDVMGPAVMGFGSLDHYLGNARIDNGIGYQGKFNHFTLGATYSFGRDTLNIPGHPAATGCPGKIEGDSKSCRAWSLLGKYDSPAWGVAAAADQIYGGAGAQNGLNSSNLRDTRITLNGYYRIGPMKVAGGVVNRRNDGNLIQPKSNLYFLGVSYPFTTQLVVDAQVGHLQYKNSPSGDKATTAIARVGYHLSKRTTLFALVGHTKNSGLLNISVDAGSAGGLPMPGKGQTSFATGIRHAF